MDIRIAHGHALKTISQQINDCSFNICSFTNVNRIYVYSKGGDEVGLCKTGGGKKKEQGKMEADHLRWGTMKQAA